VLLLDEQERVLLFRAENEESAAFWITPGGGVEDGEDARAAAVREVEEETGLADVQLGPEVWRHRQRFTWQGVEYDQRERWFLARVVHFDPDHSRMNAAEQAFHTDWRWWTVAELEATSDELVPPDLGERLRALLA
jgi:ADP-ribose pyrophosphatase YjhB (NUDIX family)